jgi:hypothetical protein
MMADDMRGVGADAAAQMGELAGQLQQDSAFKGYGVQTGLGTTTVGADGTTDLGVGVNTGMQQAGMGHMNAAGGAYGNAMGMTQGGMAGLSAQQQQALAASQNMMGQSMQDTGARAQDIYNQGMAMQQPGLDSMKAQQQAQEFAQGRSGVRGSQFGGSGEDAAMAKAQSQAMNAMQFQAMGQANQEQMQQANMANMYGNMGGQMAGLQNQGAGMMSQIAQGQGALGNQMYGNSYMDMQHQMQAAGLGGQNADRAQTGQLTGAGYGAQLGLGGIQAQVNAEKAASELFGNMYGAGMSAIGGIGNSAGSWWDNLWN